MYQPKTGQKCSCRKGVQRDNCQNCEGTGWIIDFAAIRARISKSTPKINDLFRFDDGTIGTIKEKYNQLGYRKYPVVIVRCLRHNHIFPIADLTLYQAPVISNAIWTVKNQEDHKFGFNDFLNK